MPSLARPFFVGMLACTMPMVAGAAEEEPKGRLGLRYQSLEEGLLVTAVSPNMGAEAAGIRPGALIVSAEDTPLTGSPESPRAALVGAPGSSVSLKVIDPLATDARDVDVERRLPVARAGREVPHRPASVRAYRKAVRDKGRRKAIAAAQGMVDSDFGGLPPREAVGGSLASLMRRGDRFARDVARVLATGAQDDAALLQGLARVLLQTGAADEAVALLERRTQLVEAELRLVDGAAVDVGGSFQARALHIDALGKTGDAAGAEAKARSMLSTHRDDGVAALVAAPAPGVQAEWRARLPPLAGFEVPLLDGSTWASSDHSSQVVVVNFWATWCGPCKQELPELAELYERRKSDGVEVVAVSVDTGPKEKVEEMARRLELPFAVGIDPHLTQAFQVSAFPAIRVIGADGALHYSARGYSPAAMEKLDQAIDQAMEGAASGGAPVATVWGPSAEQAALTRFFPVAGAAGVDATPDGIVVGVLGAAPVRLDPETAEPGEASVAASRGMPGQRVGWLEGAVAADPGGLLVRKWDTDGELEWLHRLPEPVSDLVVHNGVVWVSARDHLYAFGPDGGQLAVIDAALTDLDHSEDQLVGAGPGLGFTATVTRKQVEAEGEGTAEGELPADPVPPVELVEVAWDTTEQDDSLFLTSGAGDRAGGVVRQVVRGRFGPAGAERVAVVRADDRLLVFDGQGQPALVVELRRAGDLVAVDFDGDGQDSLVVGIPDHGVAWIDLSVP